MKKPRASTAFHALLRKYHRAVSDLAEQEAQTSGGADRESELREEVLKTEQALSGFVHDLELHVQQTSDALTRYERDQGYEPPPDRLSVRLQRLMLNHGYDT